MDNGFAEGYAVGQGNSNYGNNGFGWGGDWIWVIVLFALFGWGGNGFGFGGGNNGVLTRADLCEEMGFNNLDSAVRGVQQGLCDGFYAMNTNLLNGFSGVQQTMCQGFGGVNTALVQQGYETRLGVNSLSSQLAQCCCDLRAGQADIKYTMAKDTCDITNAINGAKQEIIGFMTQQELAALRTENQSLKFAASQQAQNAFITANQEAQTAELIRRLGRDCPIPAYVVPNPNCCYGNNAYSANYGNYGNSGCGCGCGCNG